MQIVGDPCNAVESFPGVDEHDSRLTHAPPGTSPCGKTSSVLCQRETHTSHMSTFTPSELYPGHPASVDAVLQLGDPLSGVGLSHWVVKDFAPPSSTRAASTPEPVYRAPIISDQLVVSVLSVSRELTMSLFCRPRPSTFRLPTIR
jgi:hypothetical protein